jgi:hypothetical protein
MVALVSFKKQRLMLAASSGENGGQRRVLERPFRGVLIIIPIAHLPTSAGFLQAGLKISGFILRREDNHGVPSRARQHFSLRAFASERYSPGVPDYPDASNHQSPPRNLNPLRGCNSGLAQYSPALQYSPPATLRVAMRAGITPRSRIRGRGRERSAL